MARPFHSAYLAGGMRGGDLLAQGFGDPQHRAERVRAAASRRLAPDLMQELRAQSVTWPASAARSEHLSRLEAGGAAMVVTGQQVGLFLGPLYTLFKAASAIAIAKALTAETGVPCVPLFWLQTEDQDFEEMATCWVPVPRGEALKLSLTEDAARARCALADRVLGAEVESQLDGLATQLGALPRASEVIDLLRRHYRPGAAPGRAFAGVLASFFAEEGLLTYDPRQRVGARLAAPVIRTSLTEGAKLDAALGERSRVLEAAGFTEQIPLRPGTSLAFFHVGDAQGARYRLTRTTDGYALPSGEALSTRDLLATLERDPLRFSTSALLRPIVQDALLPTAVYVGGPAEVDYFAQLPPLYAAFGMTPPLVALRARFRLVTPRVRALLQRLQLAASDFDRPLEELRGPTRVDPNAPGPSWLGELERHLEGYAHTVSPQDRSLRRSVERTRQTVRRAMERLASRHASLSKVRDDVHEARLREVARWLRPHGEPQERVYSFPAFAARVGLNDLRRSVMKAIVPFDSAAREIDL